MKRLKDYVKPKAGENVTTSLTLRADQIALIKKLNLNLSALVRDYLDRLQAGDDRPDDLTKAAQALLEVYLDGTLDVREQRALWSDLERALVRAGDDT